MILLGKTPTIKNLTLTNKDTEYSYVLPNATKKFTLQCRTDEDIKLAYAKGESGSNYITIPEGASQSEDNLCTNVLVLYVQCAADNVVVEISSWIT